MKKQYFIGDLCYVMHPEWDEVCHLTISGPTVLDGVFQLADGRKFVMHTTAYGDGCYHDQLGKEYGVDAGLIGAIAVEDISTDEMANIEDGNVYEFSEFPTLMYNNGEFTFTDGLNHVYINTAYEEPEDDDDDEDDD